jgi:hypothetical protein
MALAIKVIGMAQLTSTTEADLSFAAVPTGKAQIVKSMRFVNTSTTTAVGVSVYLSHGGSERLVSPKNVSLPPGGAYIDDTEITLEATDKLRGALSATGTVDYVISGVERDA